MDEAPKKPASLPFADHDGGLEKALPVLIDCAERSRAAR